MLDGVKCKGGKNLLGILEEEEVFDIFNREFSKVFIDKVIFE